MISIEDKLRNPKIEEALVGAVLINPDAFPGLSAWLAPADFQLQHLRSLWQAMGELQAGGLPIDLLTLSSRLEERDLLDQVGGLAYLTGLLNAPVTSLNAGGYARKVKELSLRRQKLEAATRLAQQALDFELPPGADPSGLELRTRFTVRSAADALRPQPPLEWVVEKIIPRASLSLFYDEPGAKKTYSMLSLAVCAASGRPWLGMRTRPVGVLVVDEETGEQRLSMRIAAALRGELCGAGTPLEYVCLSGLQLDDPGDVLLLQELIASRGAGLVVLDALTDLTSGDENAKQDMQPVFSRLRRLAEASGAALVLVHHANKLGSYRGSSAIKGAVDLMVQVQSEDGSDYISFKSEKNRDGEALR